MKTRYFLIFFIVFLFVPKNILAQDNDSIYYERLYFTCKFWGHLKYYHTEIAAGNIDWDEVLLDHLDSIKSASYEGKFHSLKHHLHYHHHHQHQPQPQLLMKPNNNLLSPLSLILKPKKWLKTFVPKQRSVFCSYICSLINFLFHVCVFRYCSEPSSPPQPPHTPHKVLC